MSKTVFFTRLALSVILPTVATIGVAVILAFKRRPPIVREKMEWGRDMLFALLSMVLAIPITFALDPIACHVGNDPPVRGPLTCGVHAIFIAAVAGGLAEWSYVLIQNARRSARLKVGKCVRCGYDLTGNVSGWCPECGTRTRPAT